MKLQLVFEEIGLGRQSVVEVNRTDGELLQQVVDLINEGGQLSWELTPSRLLSKLGSKGKIYALQDDGRVVGTVGLKEVQLVGYEVAEVGYLFVDPEFRSLKSVMSLYREALQGAKRFDFVFGTTNAKNRVINRLLERTPMMDFQFTARSPYSSNRLNYWLSKSSNGRTPLDKQETALREKFKDNIVSESVLVERSLNQVTSDHINRFRNHQRWDDVDSDQIDTSKFDEVKRNIRRFIRGGYLTIYRAEAFVGDYVGHLQSKGTVGQFWSYDPRSAQIFRGKNSYTDEYLLMAEIKEEYIDWDATLSLHTMPVRGNMEKEIRLFKNTPIKLTGVFRKDASDPDKLHIEDLGMLEYKPVKVRSRRDQPR